MSFAIDRVIGVLGGASKQHGGECNIRPRTINSFQDSQKFNINALPWPALKGAQNICSEVFGSALISHQLSSLWMWPWLA